LSEACQRTERAQKVLPVLSLSSMLVGTGEAQIRLSTDLNYEGLGQFYLRQLRGAHFIVFFNENCLTNVSSQLNQAYVILSFCTKTTRMCMAIAKLIHPHNPGFPPSICGRAVDVHVG